MVLDAAYNLWFTIDELHEQLLIVTEMQSGDDENTSNQVAVEEIDKNMLRIDVHMKIEPAASPEEDSQSIIS